MKHQVTKKLFDTQKNIFGEKENRLLHQKDALNSLAATVKNISTFSDLPNIQVWTQPTSQKSAQAQPIC